MRTIPNSIVPIAYKFSKQFYESKITKKEATTLIVGADRINRNSASDYINIFKCMLDGKVFHRSSNIYSIDYFLGRIMKDYGARGLDNALQALMMNIEYYEASQGVNMVGIRKVFRKYSNRSLPSREQNEQYAILKLLDPQELDRKKMLDYLEILSETDPAVIKINGKRYARDNKTIAIIKKLRGFKCQICNQTIMKKNGELYIEAAHIESKKDKGCELPHNILILCPNHHKEFDYGSIEGVQKDKNDIKFTMNSVPYKISLLF